MFIFVRMLRRILHVNFQKHNSGNYGGKKKDIENQIILKLVAKRDSEGAKTLGIIIKPNTIHAGSGTESRFVHTLLKMELRICDLAGVF